ncbi:MAG: AMP-binding protein, partial [Acidimicrobiales bacterium]
MFFETTLTNARIEERREWWPDERLHDALARAVAATPDKVAVVDVKGRLTYAELAESADGCAAGLLGLGVRHGDVVTVQLPNWNEFVVVMLGAERIGAIVNPIAPIFRHRELRLMLRLAQPSVVVTCGDFRGFSFPDMYHELSRETTSFQHLVVVGESPPTGATSWSELLDAGRGMAIATGVLDLLAPSPRDLAEIIFTSGTTGEPKGVMHTHDTLMSPSLGMLRAQEGDDRDVIHMASTFAHQTGYLYGARMFIQCG